MYTWQEGEWSLRLREKVVADSLTAKRWSNNFDSETDWNFLTPPMKGVDNRQVKLSRGRFLGGCSGCNGTLCIRGAKQDYDDWNLEGWGGEEFFKYMSKVKASRAYFTYYEQRLTHYHRPKHSIPNRGTKLMLKATGTLDLSTQSLTT